MAVEADRYHALRCDEAPPIGQNARGPPCQVPFAIASIVVTLAVIGQASGGLSQNMSVQLLCP